MALLLPPPARAASSLAVASATRRTRCRRRPGAPPTPTPIPPPRFLSHPPPDPPSAAVLAVDTGRRTTTTTTTPTRFSSHKGIDCIDDASFLNDLAARTESCLARVGRGNGNEGRDKVHGGGGGGGRADDGLFQSEVLGLVFEWGSLWPGRRRVRGSRFGSGGNGNLPRGPTDRITDVSRGAAMVDRLVRVVLDAKEREMASSASRLSTAPPQEQRQQLLPCRHDEEDDEDDYMGNDYDDGPSYGSKKCLTSTLCNVALHGWARCSDEAGRVPDAAFKAECLLRRMEDVYEATGGKEDVRPTVQSYNAVIDAWSRSGEDDAVHKAEALVRRMQAAGRGEADGCNIVVGGDDPRNDHEVDDRPAYATPSLITYNNLLHSYARRGKAEEATALLRAMERAEDEERDGKGSGGSEPRGRRIQRRRHRRVRPDAVSYSTAIHAWSKSQHSMWVRAAKAEELLARVASRPGVFPNRVTFTTVISLYASAEREAFQVRKCRRGSGGGRGRYGGEGRYEQGWGAKNADRVLGWMAGLWEEQNKKKRERGHDSNSGDKVPPSSLMPNTQNYVTVMNAYAKSGLGGYAARKAEDLLRSMEALYRRGGAGAEGLRPSPQCFVVVIDAWAKSNERGAAEHAEQILYRMEKLFLHARNARYKLNNYGYNLVIDAWSRSGEKGAGHQSEKILSRMREIHALSNNERVKPDAVSYTTAMRAWINEGLAENAASILSEMERLYGEGDVKSKPDTFAYATCIDGYAKSGEPKAAEAVLCRMQKRHHLDRSNPKPDKVCYNSVLNAWSRSKDEDAPQRTQAVLKQMIASHDESVRPDAVTYSTCIGAWAKSEREDKVERAETLFRDMLGQYERGNYSCKPGAHAFSCLATVYARSNCVDKVKRILQILRQVENMDIKPSRMMFNNLIGACAFVVGGEEAKREALTIAILCFNNLRNGLGADTVTYRLLVKMSRNLINDSDMQQRVLADIFHKCCEDGMVNQSFVNVLVATSPSFVRPLMGATEVKGHVKVADLPKEWSRNVTTKEKWSIQPT